MKSMFSFKLADYCVFCSTIAISFFIGIFFAIRERKKDTLVDYFLADRTSKTWPVALSFVVTFQSSLMILGFPVEAYAYGIGMVYYGIGAAIAYSFTALVFVPLFHPLKLTSVYEYFNLRYGNNSVRYVTLAAGVIYTLLYMSTVIVGTSYALDVIMGIPLWAAILIYTVVTTLYTAAGGIKGVIWTDVFQFLIMVTGVVAVLVKSSVDAGGITNVFEYAKDRLSASDFSFDPSVRYQFWTVFFGTIPLFMCVTVMQPAMQRIYSTPTVKTALNLYFISTPINSLFFIIVTFEGATIFAYYVAKRCDILDAGVIDNINDILPFSILDLFQNHPGLSGLFAAALSSASLSTLSSCLSSLSAITYEDIIKVKFSDMHSYQATRLAKLLVLLYGLLTIGLSFIFSRLPGSVLSIAVSFMGCMDGPIVAVFLLSVMFRRATSKGIIIGTISGAAVTFWLNVGSRFAALPQSPYLPPGPTDRCYLYIDTEATAVINDSVHVITSTFDNSTLFPFYHDNTMATTATDAASDPSALQSLYSISYILFSPLGFLITSIVATVVSLFTKPPENYDKRCVYSFRKHTLSALCGRNEDDENAECDMEEIKTFVKRDTEF